MEDNGARDGHVDLGGGEGDDINGSSEDHCTVLTYSSWGTCYNRYGYHDSRKSDEGRKDEI